MPAGLGNDGTLSYNLNWVFRAWAASLVIEFCAAKYFLFLEKFDESISGLKALTSIQC